MSEFTQAQLATWVAYEAVRVEGHFNMFDSNAIKASGLTTAEYFYVMKNFAAMKNAVTEQEAT